MLYGCMNPLLVNRFLYNAALPFSVTALWVHVSYIIVMEVYLDTDHILTDQGFVDFDVTALLQKSDLCELALS